MAERWAWKNFVLYGLWVALPVLHLRELGVGRWLARSGRQSTGTLAMALSTSLDQASCTRWAESSR